jgi:diguanylate cyclase (GGDEF)-like protein
LLKLTSLRQRLLVINLIAVSTSLSLISIALLGNAYLTQRSALVETLRTQAVAIARDSAPALDAGDAAAAAQALAPLRAMPEVIQAAIFDAAGKVAAAHHAQGAQEHWRGQAVESGNVTGLLTLEVAQRIPLEGPPAGLLRIEASQYSIYHRVAVYAVVIALAGIGAFGMTVLLTDRLLGRAATPLIQLARLMERVSTEKDFSLRAEVHEHDEVGALAIGFNRMLQRIQEREHLVRSELQERKRAERRLATLANYDTLTRLPNRNYFNDRLAKVLTQAARTEQTVALLFLDLDNFKIVNDTLGHHLGDSLLKAVARRIRGCVRATDAVCRLGGDEFTVILEGLSSADHAGKVAESVVAALALPFAMRDSEVYITCSIGISVYPRDGRDASTLIRRGDTAMYHAKERGKNSFQFFAVEMNDRAQKRLVLETGMRQAIERGEFVVHYQPQIDLVNGEIIGAEALLRWNRPGVGLVGPDEFIPVAEETGLIVPIGEWALWSACSQGALWQRRGQAPLRMSVNVSARQFREPDFVRTIASVLEDTQLDPALLVLELTESALMDEVDVAIAKAQDLRAMGICLAIDDFGTGYSSMSYLKRFPISEVKIDRGFVSDIPGNSDDVAITKAIVAMSQGLNIDVVAEGVETREQAAFLRGLGCQRAQGHFIGRPVPAAEFEGLLRHGRIMIPLTPDDAWYRANAA